jgi:hypothetical protein
MLNGEQMRARFQKALDLGGNAYTFEDIIARVNAGTMQSFHSDDAFVVTEVATFPRKRVLQLQFLAGELEPVLALQPQIEAFGREWGCASLSAYGRPGWQKVLPARGWRHDASCFSWSLTDG